MQALATMEFMQRQPRPIQCQQQRPSFACLTARKTKDIFSHCQSRSLHQNMSTVSELRDSRAVAGAPCRPEEGRLKIENLSPQFTSRRGLQDLMKTNHPHCHPLRIPLWHSPMLLRALLVFLYIEGTQLHLIDRQSRHGRAPCLLRS